MDKALVEQKELDKWSLAIFSPEEIDHYWERIHEQLLTVPHTWERWWTLPSLYQAAITGKLQLWAVLREKQIVMVLFSSIRQYPASRTLNLTLAFGDVGLDVAVPLLDAACSRFAQEMDCDYIELMGRPGWERTLKNFGAEKVAVVLTKKVEKERLH